MDNLKDMDKQEIINRLKNNQAACWIFWEIRNLKDTFEEPDDYEIKSNGATGKNHTMADAIENIVDQLMVLIGITHASSTAENYMRYNIFDTLEILLVQEDNEYKFILT